MKFDRTTRKIKCPNSNSERCTIVTAFICAVAIISGVILFLDSEGYFDKGCSTGDNGLVCNSQGICTNGVCVCSNAFFSGPSCSDTLAPGVNRKLGVVCSGNGYVGSPFATLEHIAPACREVLTTSYGKVQKKGGWTSKDCIADTEERLTNVQNDNGTIYDLFAVPVCQCFEGFGGPDCSQTPCVLSTDFEICSGRGNMSVTYSHNFTRSGNGCQCSKHIVNYLYSRDILSTFTADQRRTIKDTRAMAKNLAAPICGDNLYTHPEDTGVMLVYTRPEVVTHRCFCQESYFGPACEFGRCPEANGLICGGNGNPDFGFGAAKNVSVAFTDKAKLVCTAPGSVNCRDLDDGLKEDLCVFNTKHCELTDLLCPKDRPVRCADGQCVADPKRAFKGTNAFGLKENFTALIDLKLCRGSIMGNSSLFLNDLAYRSSLSGCAGDESTAAPGLIIPGGSIAFDTSLIVGMIETVDVSGTVTLTYRGKTQQWTETNPNGSVHLFIWDESYEEEQQRLFIPLQTKRTVNQVTETEVDIRPSPFVYGTDDELDPTPSEWTRIRLTTSKDPLKVVVLESSRTRMEFDLDDGDWFVANVTDSAYVIPGGKLVTLETCMESFTRCIWNTATRISYDGTKKLCGTFTSSSNLQCTPAPVTPYQRVSIVLTAEFIQDGSPILTVDWQNLGPWSIGPATIGTKDDDFTNDQDSLVITVTEGFTGLRSLAFVEMDDIVVPGACPPSTANASELNEQWWKETTRRSGDLNPGMKAIGMALYFGMPKLVRGTVVTKNLLQVKGFDNPVPVSRMAQITTIEHGIGLPHESFRVFPGMCPDGSPAKLTKTVLDNLEVDCECSLTAGRVADCMCTDEQEPLPYRCRCFIDGHCECKGGNEPGFYGLEQQLAWFVQGVQSICYYSGFTNEQGQGPLEYTAVLVDANQEVYIERSNTSDAIFLVEFRLVGGCTNGTASVYAAATVYSSELEEFQTETLCVLVNGTQHETIKPLYDSSLSDSYDRWWLSHLPSDVEVVAVFAPVGVPLTVDRVQVSSNDADKQNLVSNSLTSWTSEETDKRPTAALWFANPQIVIGLFLVFETVGIETDDDQVIIPVEVTIQATIDGNTWLTIGRAYSDVYHGNQDYWFPFGVSAQSVHYLGVRIKSQYALSVREILAMTNQRCDNELVRLQASSRFRSIQSTVLERVLSRRLNESATCICEETCVIQGRSPRAGDSCADEQYLVEGLGRSLLALTLVEIKNVSDQYAMLMGLPIGMDFRFNWTDAPVTEYLFTDELEFKAWWINDSAVPVRSTLDTNWTGNIQQSGEYFYRVIDLTKELWVKVNTTGVPQYQVYENRTLVQRGLACPTGSQCGKCGPLGRLDAKNPGLVCGLTAFEQIVQDDYLNRSDHLVQNSASLDEYLATELVVVKVDSVKFYRNLSVIARVGCGDCQGLLQCKTGQCVDTITDCPAPRYDTPGNGCTRESTDSLKFGCVCKPGFGGPDCMLQYCQPGDPVTGKINPHAWCSCGPDPPICARHGTLTHSPARGYYTTAEILTFNRGGIPQTDAADVRWNRIGTSFAPFCVRFLRGINQGGKTLRTNCPFYKRGPFGQKLSLDDCVKTRNATTGLIEEWNTYKMANGSYEECQWKTPTSYDDFPYRCPLSNTCEATESDCYLLDVINPPCGKGGKCRVDGTCDCFEGKETFSYTKEWTDLAKIPYNALNPIEWQAPKKQWLFQGHCQARNCTEGQCETVPFGCFPGSPELRFRDRHVQCPESSGNEGMCGIDYQACERGEVTTMQACSAKGYPVSLDYRNEVICRCGDPKTKLARPFDRTNITREITELKPNGWGGEHCQHYLCQDDPKQTRWVYMDPLSGNPYVDDEGITLPGKYYGGSCGAPIGPNPDDIGLWQQACPGYSRLERCPLVLCKIGKVATAVSPERCKGAERALMVYRCHGKGEARADGTCECTKDEETGQGYAPDYTRLGCFRKVSCPLASSGRACNRLDTTPDKWTQFPKTDYLDRQIFSFLIKIGYPGTAKQAVTMLVPQPEKLRKLQVAANIAEALQYQRDMATAAGSVCVIEDDDPANPYGMFPYVGFEDSIGPWMKAFKFPHEVTTQMDGLDPILVDGFYQQYEPDYSTPPRLGIEYIVTSSPIVGVFAAPTYVTHIRMYVKNPTMGTLAKFRFSNEDNETVCGIPYTTFTLDYNADLEWTWLHVKCQQVWAAHDFTQYGNLYALACLGGTRSTQCNSWKDSVCGTITGAEIQTAETLVEYAECPKSERCCVPQTIGDETVTLLKIQTDIPIQVQELVVMGYHTTVEPMTEEQSLELRWINGNISNILVGGLPQCIDDLLLNKPDFFGFDGQPYVHKTFPAAYYVGLVTEYGQHSYDTGKASCLSGGGHLIISSEAENLANYALNYGSVCCANNPLIGQRCPNECLVGAKNRNEMTEALLEDFIDPAATRFGCFIRTDGTTTVPTVTETGDRADFVSCPPLNDTIFKDNWTGNSDIKAWDTVIHGAYREMTRQGEMYGIPRINATDGTPLFDKDTSTEQRNFRGTNTSRAWTNYGPYLRHDRFTYWSGGQRNAILYTLYAPAVATKVLSDLYTPPLVNYTKTKTTLTKTGSGNGVRVTRHTGTTITTKGATVTYWTQPKTCKITFYTHDHCGLFMHGDNAANEVTRLKGMKAVYFVTPGDDYETLGKNLFAYPAGPFQSNAGYYNDGTHITAGVWQECADPTLNIFDTNCAGQYSGQYVNSVGFPARSLSVEGPCKVYLESQVTDLPDGSPDPRGSLNRQYIETDIFMPNGHSGATNEGLPATYGCAPMCLQGMRCAYSSRRACKDCVDEPVTSGPMNPSLGYSFVDAPPLGQVSSTTVPYAPVIDSDWTHSAFYTGLAWDYNFWATTRIKTHFSNVRVAPLFDSFKIEINFRAEGDAPADDKTGVCYMFWKTHPFMCMRVEVRVLDSVQQKSSGYFTTADRSFYTDSRVNSSQSLLKVEPVMYSTEDGELLNTDEVYLMIGNPGLARPLRFPPCLGLGREIKECPSCIVQHPVGKWEFDPRKYFPAKPTTFSLGVTKMRQAWNGTDLETVDGLPRPKIHINRTAYLVTPDGTLKYQSLESRRYVETRFYGALIAAFNQTHFQNKQFQLDNCVVVKATEPPVGVLTPSVPYTLDTTVCVSPTHFALCMRDHTKNAVQRGRQCAECGTSTRPGGNADPGGTVFTEFPKLNRDLYGDLYQKYVAFIEGRINDYTIETDPDWEGLLSYIMNNGTDSLIAGFPEFRTMLADCYSDRPGRLSGSATVEDKVHWVDFCVSKIWSVDCGERCSSETGICRKRRAIDFKWCDPDLPMPPKVEIPEEDYPLGLLPVTETDAYKIPRCGVKVDPSPYYKADKYGFPSASTKNFVVLEDKPGESIWLRLTRDVNSSWQNTGKSAHDFIFRNTTTLYGEFTCSRVCTIGIWVSGLSPSYTTDPDDRVMLGTYSTSPFTIDLSEFLEPAAYFRSLGWDIDGMGRGDTVTLKPIIASNPTTIADCRNPVKRPIYQPDPFFEYSEPINKCLFDYQQDPITEKNGEPGQCMCLDPSYGGTTCEAPSIISGLKSGKFVCGGYAPPGFMALDRHGNRVPVNPDGSWQSLDKSHWGCKMLNPGLIFRTKFFPATRFNFPFVFLTQSLAGQIPFVEADPLEDSYDEDNDGSTDELITQDLVGTQQTCASASATLPSWYTTDEVNKFMDMAEDKEKVFVDLEFTGEYFKWAERSTEVIQCTEDNPCGQPQTVTPCEGDPTNGSCLAIQFNNLAFEGTDPLTDGTSTTTQALAFSATVNIDLTVAVTGEGVTVKIFPESAADHVTVSVVLPTTDACTRVTGVPYLYDFNCTLTTGTERIRLTGGAGGTTINEVHIYRHSDLIRLWQFYTL